MNTNTMYSLLRNMTIVLQQNASEIDEIILDLYKMVHGKQFNDKNITGVSISMKNEKLVITFETLQASPDTTGLDVSALYEKYGGEDAVVFLIKERASASA